MDCALSCTVLRPMLRFEVKAARRQGLFPIIHDIHIIFISRTTKFEDMWLRYSAAMERKSAASGYSLAEDEQSPSPKERNRTGRRRKTMKEAQSGRRGVQQLDPIRISELYSPFSRALLTY